MGVAWEDQGGEVRRRVRRGGEGKEEERGEKGRGETTARQGGVRIRS